MKNYYSNNKETYEPMRLTKAQIAAIIVATISFAAVMLTSCTRADGHECMRHEIVVAETDTQCVPTLEELTDDILEAQYEAVRYMESRGNRQAYNKRGNAHGPVQITPIMLREFKRITGRADELMPTISDLYDEEISRMIFDTIILYHNPELDIYETAEIWHPGHSRKYMNGILEQMQKRM